MKGRRVKTESGRLLLLGEVVGAGGEGQVYRATDEATGETLAVKMFGDRFKTPQTRERMRHLVHLRLQDKCAVLCAPVDVVSGGDTVGHCARWVPGDDLETWLQDPQYTMSEALQMALAISDGLDVLHRMGIAFGDIHSRNVRVLRDGSDIRIHLIDLDNYRAAGVPPPMMVGQALYVAPELRSAMDKGEVAVPNLGTDCFELGVLLHEILLLRHPAAGHDMDSIQFGKAMCSGTWVHDRSRNCQDASTLGGYPVSVLNPELESLFRTVFDLVAALRPTPARWKEALARAIESVGHCPRADCSVQFVVDAGKTHCPMCKRLFPTLALRTPTRQIPLATAAVSIGRGDFAGAPKVSQRHVIFRKTGPGTWLTPVGSNPTYRWSGKQWIQLPNDRTFLVSQGDRIRLADVETLVVGESS